MVSSARDNHQCVSDAISQAARMVITLTRALFDELVREIGLGQHKGASDSNKHVQLGTHYDRSRYKRQVHKHLSELWQSCRTEDQCTE
jgi:hypothetical protein